MQDVIGSSPRGRGKPLTTAACLGLVRLIPAWAGKTMRWTTRRQSNPAHPRVGGENARLAERPPARRGSSPRGRGKLSPHRRWRACRGLIPAWAGKTDSLGLIDRADPAHPRVGGENRSGSGWLIIGPGSSPRGRGKQSCRCVPWVLSRLIPAWAGKTASLPVSESNRAAHPRVGGENADQGLTSTLKNGSSPRGRGKPVSPTRNRVNRGLIPAWAGKTCAFSHSTPSMRAHPRVGGENPESPSNSLLDPGSSPRGRGKPCMPVAFRVVNRLIPAWAGKTMGSR